MGEMTVSNHIIDTIPLEINKEMLDIIAEIIAYDILKELEAKQEVNTNVRNRTVCDL